MQPQHHDLAQLAQQLLQRAEERIQLRDNVVDALMRAAQQINQIEQNVHENLAQLDRNGPTATQLQQLLMELHHEFLHDLRAVAPEMNEQDLRLQLLRSIGLTDQQIALVMASAESG
ncbi:MAG: hypothetical protein JNJ94_17140 [Chlorobi bacterium]|nr:hypothetical protein [Chlorobiota bacterium]